MSIPASLREGPRTTNALAKKAYLIVYLLIMTLGAQPTVFCFWAFWKSFYSQGTIFYILFPVVFLLGVIVMMLSSAIISKIFLSIANLFHRPKQGIFKFNKNDKDYCYWSLRSVIKKWPIWLGRQLSIPFFETLIYRILGVHVPFSAALHDSWTDCEFIKIGKRTKIGQGTIIMSNLIIEDKLIIKEVVIGQNVLIGARSVILPGTIIEDNAVIDCNSVTGINQHIDQDQLYRGNPAIKIAEMNSFKGIQNLQDTIFKPEGKIEDEDNFLRAHVKELRVPFHLYIISGIIIIGFSFIVPGFIFYFYVFKILAPYLFAYSLSLSIIFNPFLITLLLLTPLIFIAIYLLHLFFVALFTKYFYRVADKRGPSHGIYDRNLETSIKTLDYYHFGSFLMKYPIFAFSRSPFPWFLNWELNFLESNKIGKDTILEETFIHSHINFGNKCYLGTFSHMTNHVVDGVYGEENLTFIGVNIGNRVILSPITGGLPGTEIGDDATLLPGCTTLKYDKLIGNGVYGGFPAKRLSDEEIKKLYGEDKVDQ
jgi:acetyltransferase-like isoleucine patch superfamily enzyme